MDPDSPSHHKIRHFSVVEFPLEAQSSTQILLFGEFLIKMQARLSLHIADILSVYSPEIYYDLLLNLKVEMAKMVVRLMLSTNSLTTLIIVE